MWRKEKAAQGIQSRRAGGDFFMAFNDGEQFGNSGLVKLHSHPQMHARPKMDGGGVGRNWQMPFDAARQLRPKPFIISLRRGVLFIQCRHENHQPCVVVKIWEGSDEFPTTLGISETFHPQAHLLAVINRIGLVRCET